jgi:ribose/xylose/arabinose/galactoside ABC-type transport system permease subunit
MNRRLLPLTITILLFIAMAAFGAIRYDGFLSPQVFLNLLIDNAFLCIVAVGMTFVILSGGIDLSVGAVIALTTMISASLLDAGWNPYAAMAVVLVFGAAFGALQGFLIQRFNLAPFLVTLAGMFLARGCCYLISTESIPIGDATYAAIAQARIPVGFGASLTIGGLIALAVVAVAMRVAHSTEFGRTVYAIGGGESSARLMGLSVDSTKIGV